MSYRLQPDEPLAEGLKRIAREQVFAAIEGFQSQPDLQEGVYRARKSLKRARAILGLLEPQLGPIFVEENRRLREIARRFSALRDADVSLEVLNDLAAQYKRKSTLNPQRQALLEKQTTLQQETDWTSQMLAAVESLSSTCKRVEDWPLRGLTQADLEKRVRKFHKHGRRALKTAVKTGTADDFHELRKSVKTELNQMRLIGGPDELVEEMKKLAALLGDHHNLAVLGSKLEQTSGRFRQLTRRQQKQYEKQAIELAAHLYLPGPPAGGCAT